MKTALPVIALVATALAGCTTPETKAAEQDGCRARAEKSGNTNDLFYCPEDFEGPLEPPPAGQGIQLVYGPREQAVPEQEMCLTVEVEGDQEVLIRQYEARMRPGSHHFLLYKSKVDLPDGVYYPCFAGYPNDGVETVPEFAAAGVTEFSALSLSWLAGLQAPGALKTPNYEDYGIAMRLPPKVQLILNVHYVNVTEGPITQEVWINAWFAENKANIKEDMGFITFIGAPLSVSPKVERQRISFLAFLPEEHMDAYAAKIGKPVDELRIYLLTGHAHARLVEMEVSIERADGSVEEVYYTDSWYEPAYTFFEEPIVVRRGDKIRYTCYYRNEENRFINFGETTSDEMCNVFGVYAPGLGGNWLNATILD